MIVKVFDINGKEHQVECDDIHFNYPDGKTRIMNLYKDHTNVASFYADKILGYEKIECEEDAPGETNENNNKTKTDEIEYRFDIISARFDNIYSRLKNLERVAEKHGYVLKPCPRCGEIAEFIAKPINDPATWCYTGRYKLEIKCEECNLSVSECCDEDKFEETEKKLFKEWEAKEFKK